MKYVIGIDGGGTGSKAIVADARGNILETLKGGATNYVGGQKDVIDANVRDLFTRATDHREINECMAICFGSAGVSSHEAKRAIEEIAFEMGFICPIQITTDSHTAHAGALTGQKGILIIAGTGSICLVRYEDEIGHLKDQRIGGYGHLIDDEGSGYDIAKRMLRAIVESFDGRGAKTALKDIVFEKMGFTELSEMITWLYSPTRSKKDIAALSVLLTEAIEAGDVVAMRIARQAAESLAKIVETGFKYFSSEETVNIAVSGSVLQKNERIRKEFTDALLLRAKNCNVIFPEHEADFGAMLLALQMVSK